MAEARSAEVGQVQIRERHEALPFWGHHQFYDFDSNVLCIQKKMSAYEELEIYKLLCKINYMSFCLFGSRP